MAQAKKKDTETKPQDNVDYDSDDATGDIVELPKADAGNEFNVPDEQWAAWNDNQKAMFNAMHGKMKLSPSRYNAHPDALRIDPDQWRVICWNVALDAAACA